LSDGGEAVAFHGVGEETAASNTDKSAWRNVLQKSPEEFIAVEGHDLVAAAVAVILHPERNACVVDVDESAVADGHAVNVASEVAQHLSRRSASILPRNTFDIARTENRNRGFGALMNALHWASQAPPATTQWMCGWCDRFCPQVCSTDTRPGSPGRFSRANRASVADDARNRAS
jgi:hypothetical protein